VILDLHTHTKEHSPCSHQTAQELILRAVEVGLDGIALTDHDHFWTRNELEEVLQGFGGVSLLVLRGQEVSCEDGHLLVYGINETVRGDGPRADVAQKVRDANGATVLPHPFRWEGFKGIPDERVAEETAIFDAIEALTTNHSESEQERALSIGRLRGVHLIGASDAHSVDRVGAFATRLARPVRTEADLVEVLRHGGVSPVRRDPVSGYVPSL
jgi:hypothetical protein